MDKTLFPVITEEDKKLPFILKSVGTRENQEHIIRTDGYPDYHWLHSAKGKGLLKIEGKEIEIKEDMGFFLKPAVPHEYFALTESWETHWITFEGYAVSNLLELLKMGSWGVFNINGRSVLERALDNIYLSGKSANPARSFECSALLYQFLILLKTSITIDSSKQKLSGRSHLHPVILFIEDNYNKNITLKDMAEVINVTPQHLCRLFKQNYGTRPFDYLIRYRLQKAKELILSLANPSIKTVSIEVGYNDTSYFCAIFKRYEGLSPTEFKNLHCS